MRITRENMMHYNIGLATKWLRILSLDGIAKIRNHLVASQTVSIKLLSWVSVIGKEAY